MNVLLLVVLVVVLLIDDGEAAFSVRVVTAPPRSARGSSIVGRSRHSRRGKSVRHCATRHAHGGNDGKVTTTTMASSASDGSISTRRTFVQSCVIGSLMIANAAGVAPPRSAWAAATTARAKTGAMDGNLPDLPPEACRSYLQYRIPLQISADYYLLEFQDKIGTTDEWGEVNQLFATGSARGGQGQPNRLERDFVNPMRILALSMPPDEAEGMRDAQFRFERALGAIGSAVAGVRRDLPVEISPADIQRAQRGWEEGRVAINEFFTALNGATGLTDELRTIPPAGPDQVKSYGRSPRRYYELMKKTKLCQNRGGPTLSQAWGGLMVSGYMQDSCGIPDMDEYFFQ